MKEEEHIELQDEQSLLPNKFQESIETIVVAQCLLHPILASLFLSIFGVCYFALLYYFAATRGVSVGLILSCTVFMNGLFFMMIAIVPPKEILFVEFILFGSFYYFMISYGNDYKLVIKYLSTMYFPQLLYKSVYSYFLAARFTLQDRKSLRYNQNPMNAILFNYGCYFVPHFVGLHWEFLSDIPGLGTSLSQSSVVRWKPIAWCVYSLGGVVVFGLILFHIYLICKSDRLWYFVILYVFLTLSYLSNQIFNYFADEIHLHHRDIAAFFLPLTSFDNPISAVCQGLALAIQFA